MGVTVDGANNVVKVNDIQVLKAQEAAVADAAAATAAAQALTGSALTDSSGGTPSATIADITDVQNAGSADRVPTENAIASLAAELENNRADIATQKAEIDKLITDHASVLAQLNALLAKLRTHGIIAT